jgi:NAD(P)H dehydrogenase (quinone)
MKILLLDGHPDSDRLLTHLLDHYQELLQTKGDVQRINVRDLTFAPDLAHGFATLQPWEPDLVRVAHAISDADHLVIGFPLWWGAEPALLKGLMDRVLLPGFAYKYHRENVWWDRLLSGRSADVIVTMDTPPLYLRLAFGDAVMRRWKRQVLGFCGVKPIRLYRFGPTRRGEAKKRIDGWKSRLASAAKGVTALNRGSKTSLVIENTSFNQALKDQMP